MVCRGVARYRYGGAVSEVREPSARSKSTARPAQGPSDPMMTARSMYEGRGKNGRYEPKARSVVTTPAPGRERQMVLLRQLLGDVLRRLRVRQKSHAARGLHAGPCFPRLSVRGGARSEGGVVRAARLDLWCPWGAAVAGAAGGLRPVRSRGASARAGSGRRARA